MASHIKKGESLLIPFRNGISISDSQLRPRMYKTIQAFEKSFPGYYLGTDGVELVEFVPVVRCKDCKHCEVTPDALRWCNAWGGINGYGDDGFCSYGERRTDDEQ